MGLGARGTRRVYARVLTRLGIVAVLYLIGARAGLAVAFENRNVTAVWPPTGIAVAALLVWGLGMWPGIAIGAFVANLSNHAGISTSAAITIGNTLAPVAAVYALRHIPSFDEKLERMRDVLALFVFAGLGAMSISATFGTAALVLTGAAQSSDAGSVWLVWWIGDAFGVMLFAPFLVLAARQTPDSGFNKRWRESILLVAFAVGIALVVFNVRIPLAYLILLPVVWAAFSFEQLGATLMTVVLALLAVAETVSGHGPFASGTPTQNLVSLQAFNAILAFTGLSLASVVRARRHAEETLRSSEGRYRRLFNEATDVIWVHDLDGKITYANPASEAVTGVSAERQRKMLMDELLGPDQAIVMQRAVRRLVEGTDTTSYEIELRGPSSNVVALDISAVLVRSDGEVSGVQLIGRDVTARKIAEGHLRRNALRDPGTGLPNRTLLFERIEYALAMTHQTKSQIALYILDIDGFARINSERGLGAGDTLLRAIAHRLNAIARPTDTVARIGGDEFALLIAPIHDDHEADAFAMRIAAEVRASSDIGPTVAIGITLEDEETNVEALLRRADLAMQEAKRRGPGNVRRYGTELEAVAGPLDAIRTQLERALDR